MVQQKENTQSPSQKANEKQNTKPQNEHTRSAPSRNADERDSRK